MTHVWCDGEWYENLKRKVYSFIGNLMNDFTLCGEPTVSACLNSGLVRGLTGWVWGQTVGGRDHCYSQTVGVSDHCYSLTLGVWDLCYSLTQKVWNHFERQTGHWSHCSLRSNTEPLGLMVKSDIESLGWMSDKGSLFKLDTVLPQLLAKSDS